MERKRPILRRFERAAGENGQPEHYVESRDDTNHRRGARFRYEATAIRKQNL